MSASPSILTSKIVKSYDIKFIQSLNASKLQQPEPENANNDKIIDISYSYESIDEDGYSPTITQLNALNENSYNSSSAQVLQLNNAPLLVRQNNQAWHDVRNKNKLLFNFNNNYVWDSSMIFREDPIIHSPEVLAAAMGACTRYIPPTTAFTTLDSSTSSDSK